MEKSYRVNIDYDLQIALNSHKPLKPNWQREWEYLFWWVESDDKTLSSHFKYDEQDLKYIAQKTERKNFLSHSDDPINWWGDLNLKGLLKTDLPGLRKELFNDEHSYIGNPRKYPCVLKKDGSFSGKGVYILRSETDFFKLRDLKKNFIIEPLRNITLDFSYYQFQNDRIFYRSIVKDTQYLGSLFSKDLDWLPGIDQINTYADKLRDFLNISEYGVDCYYYEQEGIKLEPLCEINSRKTIASVAYRIYQKYLSEYKFARNIIIPMKNIDISKLQAIDDPRFLRLSPIMGQFFLHALVVENTQDDLMRLTDQFQKFLNRS